MGLPGLSRRGLGFLVMGTIGLLVVISFFCAEGRSPTEADQMTRRPEARDVTPGSGDVKVCTAAADSAGREAGGDLQLDATTGVALKFSCGQNLQLRPQKKGANTHENVYLYEGADSKRACKTDSESGVPLAQELNGATLTEETAQGGSSRGDKSPVYVFQYKTAPTEDKHLCYTCNKASASSDSDAQPHQRTEQEGGAGTVACTVYIKVPKKKEESTSSSTPSPDSPSGARAMPTAIATAVGGFLAVMALRM